MRPKHERGNLPNERGWMKRKVRHRFIEWLTTAPHPTRPAHTHSADDGQVGWKLHLVIAHPDQHKKHVAFAPRAMCGLRPKHGWGVDLFIDEPCTRCLARAEKRGLNVPYLMPFTTQRFTY